MIPSQPYADQKKQHADWRFCGRQPIRERAARCKSAWCRKLRRGSLHSQHRDNQSARQRCTLQARVDQGGRSQALRGGLCRIASASLVSPEDVPAQRVWFLPWSGLSFSGRGRHSREMHPFYGCGALSGCPVGCEICREPIFVASILCPCWTTTFYSGERLGSADTPAPRTRSGRRIH